MFDTSDEYVNLLVCLIVLVIFLVYYYCIIVRLPVLSCPSRNFKTFLYAHMPILSEKYWPTIWCYEARIQTILAFLCSADFDVPYKREILELNDGGQVALDWLYTKNKNTNAPIILILPGYTGTSATTYVKRFAINARKRNFHCVTFNYRGLGGVELKTPKLYSANDTTDLVQVVLHIKERFPDAILGACGISMGSIMLAQYLIKHSHLREISVAMLNNTLFDIFVAREKMNFGLDSFFNRNLTGYMLEVVSRFKEILDVENAPWNIAEVMRSKTVQEFDDKLTIKMFGYKSVYEYYKDVNIADKMDKIEIPTLCLNAADDPSQPFEYPENGECLLFDNKRVAVMLTATGGHISHLEGLWPFHKKTTYMHRVFDQYFSAMFQNHAYKQFISRKPT